MLLARSVLRPTSWPGAAAPGSQKPPGGGLRIYKKSVSKSPQPPDKKIDRCTEQGGGRNNDLAGWTHTLNDCCSAPRDPAQVRLAALTRPL
jgi:hypothetical protein